MSSITTPTKPESKLYRQAADAADQADLRYNMAPGIRRQLNKVFPTHWSFLLGEIALYTFIILILTGIYLTLFFDPSMEEVTYHGVFRNLQDVEMSKAFASTLDISFEVRGGLFIRQLHHWAALLFVAGMMAHMFRIFFTGAFRRPREGNWTIGALLLILGMFEGFFGYSLPDDLLSGTGVRATMSGIVLSVPVIGTWVHWALFGGEFPGMVIIPRLYILHVLVLPGIMLGLIAVHLALVWYQKHTQFPGVRRKESNVVGIRILPTFALKSGAFFALTTGVLAIMGGVFQINPIWNLGPYIASQVSAASQPDWYLMWADGILRIWPAWELYIGPYTVPPVFFCGALGMGILFTLLISYPMIERKLNKDDAHHNLLQRPRDVPVRTSLGMMALSFFLVLQLSGMNDVIAFELNISLNAMTWMGRIGLLLLPPITYFFTYRICLGLQRADHEVLEHGVETGIIKRLPHGEFIEVHQPLGPVDSHGHPEELPYQGAPVPKKMNKLGAAGTPVAGSLLKPDPAEETEALERAHAENERREREELEQRELVSGRQQQPTE
ncbi:MULTISPECIES: cytochrome bc complex cytochrome b subunit [unclassified Saccharopolyspora]|uniref:cytochrome bc1 complex cytochrome b subunit n=2 Tax=Pseudonocardiaceae TaxID=2070 RepID=UPI00190AB486|nr:cytochrome bc complex cytochrome b subunit [Saccharopolyspora sp. HNM0986]MBK0868492.1 cytochrome bc complex cytochrome b subunit [Saccharopolyspora sp. HNM0986]